MNRRFRGASWLVLLVLVIVAGCATVEVEGDSRLDQREAVYHPAPADLETLDAQ